ncbi:MAG: cryptochrome/photolyase family protein [Granulosicoccus sp.]
MTTIALIFPHQLFADHPVLRESLQKVLLVEHSLFFGDKQYPLRFHKQKLAYHRATMQAYAGTLRKKRHKAEIVPYSGGNCCLAELCEQARSEGVDKIVVAEVNDFTLRKRLIAAIEKFGLDLAELDTPGFINTQEENREWRGTRKRWFMADFYQWQRTRLDIMMDGQKPLGGQWSFDEDNRKKLPKAEIEALPQLPTVNRTAVVKQAIESVEDEFADAPGSLENWYYPTTHAVAEKWLDTFLEERFVKFGPYEDAIAAGHNWLHHSILTPMLNTGLLTPKNVIESALKFADKYDVPLNSLEGFIRQILGWREFMRATYDDLGVPMRTTNHWKHTRKLPGSFYDGTTGIDPIDDAILRILDTGYCHHIERLMILGGFMFLCEIDPDDIYGWFMEMFIDSYDWVMVPNVYAMSQHADGGAITTKPYFSGSNYVLKMSNFKKGEWSEIWDALFWRWIIRNSDALKGNPRWAMMVRNGEKMSEEKRSAHLKTAASYLKGLR